MSKVDLGEALANVRAAANTEEQSAYLVLLNVQTARELGATWADIGRALGTSTQSAWERFHNKIPVTTETDTLYD